MNNNRNSGGIGFIAWYWLWVLSPFRIPMGFRLSILVISGSYLAVKRYFRRRAMKIKWGKD